MKLPIVFTFEFNSKTQYSDIAGKYEILWNYGHTLNEKTLYSSQNSESGIK